MKTSFEEVASLSVNKEETVKEIEAKYPTPALETEALKGSTAKPQLRSTSLHNYKDTEKEVGRVVSDCASKSQELEDEHKPSESITQLQQEGLGETKITEASHTTNIPFDDISMDSKLNERAEEGSTSKDAVVSTMIAAHLASSNSLSATSSIVSQVGDSQSWTCKETEKQFDRGFSASRLRATTSPDFENINDIMEQGLEKNCPEYDAMTIFRSTDSDSSKQSTGPIDYLSRKNSALTLKETVDHSRVQEEAELSKLIKATLPQVIPSLHHKSQSPYVGTTATPNKLGVCEIFQLVKLKDGETVLLAQALERYPQLLLRHEHRSHRMISWSYRVLVDILVVLATKTPYSITVSEKSTLEDNLCDATLLGFDKEWVDSVRSRVFGLDMSDVMAAEEDIQVKEAELETCDIALEQVRKQSVEAKGRVAVARRQLEVAQTEFGATDSQLSRLLEERKKLISGITESREIISAKDRPFGI